jgi:SPP1 gp7 family putative phage head morphogenesis protein
MTAKHNVERISKESTVDLRTALLYAIEQLGIDLERLLTQVNEDPYALARAVRGADWETTFAAPVRNAYAVGAFREYNRRFSSVATHHALRQFLDGEGNSPYARAHVSFRGASLVREIDASIRAALISAVDDGFIEYRNSKDVARAIVDRKIIGLDTRLQNAVYRRARLMREQGIAEEKIAKESAKYSKKLLKYRADMIARSEMISAANEGHLEAWKLGIDQGMINKRAQKQWIAGRTERTCIICNDLHGQKALIHSPFRSNVTGQAIMRPTAHPSCRCTMILILPGQ